MNPEFMKNLPKKICQLFESSVYENDFLHIN